MRDPSGQVPVALLMPVFLVLSIMSPTHKPLHCDLGGGVKPGKERQVRKGQERLLGSSINNASLLNSTYFYRVPKSY